MTAGHFDEWGGCYRDANWLERIYAISSFVGVKGVKMFLMYDSVKSCINCVLDTLVLLFAPGVLLYFVLHIECVGQIKRDLLFNFNYKE